MGKTKIKVEFNNSNTEKADEAKFIASLLFNVLNAGHVKFGKKEFAQFVKGETLEFKLSEDGAQFIQGFINGDKTILENGLFSMESLLFKYMFAVEVAKKEGLNTSLTFNKDTQTIKLSMS